MYGRHGPPRNIVVKVSKTEIIVLSCTALLHQSKGAGSNRTPEAMMQKGDGMGKWHCSQSLEWWLDANITACQVIGSEICSNNFFLNNDATMQQ